MRVFTNGKLTVLRTPTHLVRWPIGGKVTVEKSAVAGQPATDDHHDGRLLFSPSGEDLSVAFADALKAAKVLDTDVLDEERIALLRDDQTLVWGTPPAAGKWAMEAKLAELRGVIPVWASKVKLHRPGGRDDLDGEEQACEDELDSKQGTGFPGGNLLANANGIGVTSSASGNVVLFRPDETEPALLLRLASEPEDRLYARPTKVGLLITAIFNGRHTVVFHVGKDGKLRAMRQETEGGGPPAIRIGRKSLDFEGDKAVLRDARLKSVSRLDAQVTPVTLAAALDGRHFAFAESRDTALVLCELDKGELHEADRINYTDLKRQTKARRNNASAKRAYDPKRVPGEATIGFAAKPTITPPWTVPLGDFELELILRSAGGTGRGLSLRFSGAALADVTLESIAFGDTRVPFEPDGDGIKAVLPDVELVDGLVLPLQPKPTSEVQKAIAAELLEVTHLRLCLRGTARKTGSNLMRVEVSPIGASSAPLKWMRPFNAG